MDYTHNVDARVVLTESENDRHQKSSIDDIDEFARKAMTLWIVLSTIYQRREMPEFDDGAFSIQELIRIIAESTVGEVVDTQAEDARRGARVGTCLNSHVLGHGRIAFRRLVKATTTFDSQGDVRIAFKLPFRAQINLFRQSWQID